MLDLIDERLHRRTLRILLLSEQPHSAFGLTDDAWAEAATTTMASTLMEFANHGAGSPIVTSIRSRFFQKLLVKRHSTTKEEAGANRC